MNIPRHTDTTGTQKCRNMERQPSHLLCM